METPWGFTVSEALEAIQFKKMVESDSSPYNPYALKPKSVLEVYFPTLSCDIEGCWEMRLLREDSSKLIPKYSPRYNINEHFCRAHFLEEWNKRNDAAEAEREKTRWAKVLDERMWALRALDDRVRRLETADLREVMRQNKDDYRAERATKRYKGPPRPGFVYHLYTVDKELLYVGKTYDFERRCYGTSGHAQSKPWWPLVFGAMVTQYKTEEDALLAESLCIARENPRYNIMRPTPKITRLPRKTSRHYVRTRVI